MRTIRLLPLLAASVFALSSGVAAAEPTVTPQQIAGARTAADHAAIAAAYEAEAARLEQKAKEHQDMAREYGVGTSGKGTTRASMKAHCARLADIYQDAAREYRAMALEHQAPVKPD